MKAFTTTTNSVVQWCCAKESHKRSGVHYHVTIKLKRTKRWLPSKNTYSTNMVYRCTFPVCIQIITRHENMLQRKMHSKKRVKGTLTYLILLVRRQYEHMRSCKSGGSRDINSKSANVLLIAKPLTGQMHQNKVKDA